MFGRILKIVGATILFAGIHSILASKGAKETAVKLLGVRKRNGLYRVGYNVIALATLGALAFYAFRLPNRDLYRVRGPLAGLMLSIQLFFLLYLFHGARQIGIFRFAGVSNFAALLTGQSIVPFEPEGQGPVLDRDGRIRATGPFRSSRHPLNFGMIPVLWLMPRMTVNLASFNVLVSLYLIAGSYHEEKRLTEAYGSAYTDYQNDGAAFFVPAFPRKIVHKRRLSDNKRAAFSGRLKK